MPDANVIDGVERRARSLVIPLVLAATALAVALPGSARAQQSPPPFLQPSRPVIANSAEVQRTGVLQIETGYSGYHDAGDFDEQQSMPLTLRLALSQRLLVDADQTVVQSQRDTSGARATGGGDLWLGAQGVMLMQGGHHPALAVAYFAKLPTASAAKGLGTGRVDHRVVLLLSRTLGQTEIDLNGAWLNVGRPGDGRVSGGQVALAVGNEPDAHGFGVQGELSAQNEPTGDPRGAYALGALTWHGSERLRLDAGARAGLTHDAPKYELFGGLTTGVALWR